MTVKEVARAVGVSEATLYRHIKTEPSRRKEQEGSEARPGTATATASS